MKLFAKYSMLLFITILLGCGKDGMKGNAKVALDWDWYVDAYSDNNSAIPSTISKNKDYNTGVGTFNGIYFCSDGTGDEWYWEFSYTISINEGEPGKLFRKGDDGKDKYFKINLHGLMKPTVSVSEKSENQPAKLIKEALVKTDFNIYDSDKNYIGDEITDSYIQDGALITLKRRMFTVK